MVKAKYTLSEVKSAAEKLAGRLEKAGIKISGIFLYGSYARGASRDYSDIDVAIISPDFKGKDRMVIQETIAMAIVGRSGILSAIEPIGFSVEEFTAADRATFLGEIKRTGRRLI
jgi:uncharacterized protein